MHVEFCIQVNAVVHLGGSPTDLQHALLQGRKAFKHFLFTGHGDVPMPSAGADEGADARRTVTLGFTNAMTKQFELTMPENLADTLSSHGLSLIFLNGCSTADLGRKLRARGVPHVVCWQTKAADAASRTLARTFFSAVAAGRSFAEAFGDATQAVKNMTTSRGGPLFELSNPDEVGAGEGGPPWAAGVPLLLSEDSEAGA